MKPTVYIETSVIGYLTSWPSGDLIVASRQKVTKDWWRDAHAKFDLVVSELVVAECSTGDPVAIEDRMNVLDPLRVIVSSRNADDLAAALLEKGAVPWSEPEDALHIALAVVNSADYLVTWNFKHIANASMRHRIFDVCVAAGYSPSTICSPEELQEANNV
jgi:hypothetical protein